MNARASAFLLVVCSTRAWGAPVDACPGGARPGGVSAPSDALRRVTAEAGRRLSLTVPVGVTAAVSSACHAPSGVFFAPTWVPEADLAGAPAGSAAYSRVVWALASFAAASTERRSVEAESVAARATGCALGRSGLRGDPLYEAIDRLVTALQPMAPSAGDSLRALVTQGAATCSAN